MDILPSNEINPKHRLSHLEIWQFAKENNYHILTFDKDFTELQNMFSFPLKIIWLRCGNSTTAALTSLLKSCEKQIESFLTDDEDGVYEIYA